MRATETSTSSNYFFVVISAVAALAGILFGYDTGVISGAILFISHQFHLTPFMNGLVVAAVLVGATLGAIISGRITDRFGRKHLLMTVAVIFIAASIGTALAHHVYTLILGRIVVGIAIGIASYSAPLYISEISPPKYRGAMVSLNQLAISVGMMISYVVDYVFAIHANWRWMFAIGAVPAFGLLIGMIVLPYSPRWKVACHQIEHAIAILKRIRGKNVDVMPEFLAIQEGLKIQKGNWRMLFSKTIRPVLIVGMGLAIIQQVTGINTILYYAPTIFTMTGFHGTVAAILASLSVGGIFVLFTIIALPLIDSLGRRPLLFIGLIGMCLGLLLLAWVFHHQHNAVLQWVALGGMLLYIASFAISLGPVMWLIIAEIYPLSIRGLGASIATATNWAANMIIAMTFLTLVEWLSTTGTFLLYFGFGIISLLFVYFLIPETKGIALEQIEKNLYAGVKSRDLGKHE